MTNSLLAMHPAVQHMVLHLMNINAVKYKWSSGTRADGWETPADGIIIQKASPHVFLIRSPPQLPRMLPCGLFKGRLIKIFTAPFPIFRGFGGVCGFLFSFYFVLVF